MKHVTKIGAGAIIYITSLIKIGSGTQKLFGRSPIQTQRQ
jgi:hypothetical protein